MTQHLTKEKERNSAVCNCPHGVAVILVCCLWFGGYGSVSTRALTLGGEKKNQTGMLSNHFGCTGQSTEQEL